MRLARRTLGDGSKEGYWATVLALADAMKIYAIEVAPRGERDPIVPTPADGAVEPRNRAAEIKVR
jgi:hypothetical protein